jgi:SAM-dependent methyltransferase
MKKRPISIENRWDILYRDYPEIYDEFANVPYEPKMIDILHEKFDFSKKKVVDIGSGSGHSTIEIAKYAEYVIGVEPEKSMRSIAKKNTADKNLENVFYIEGKAEKIPLDDYSADMVPGWYGGELSSVFDIQDEHAVNEELQNVHRLFVENNGFSFFDINSTSYYGSLEKIINTYGFIFGKKMIRHLKQNNITSIKWKFRVHYIQN